MQKLRSVTKMLFFGILLSSIMSCGEDEVIELGSLDEDYLVFGHYYGACGGEGCVENFALTKDELYEDTNDNYGGIDFNFIAKGDDKFKNKFPSCLIT